MKKVIEKLVTIFLLITITIVPLAGCGKNHKDSKNNQTELTVFAASSMTETLNEIAEKYKEVNPEVKILFNFDSSGTLKTQIEEGAYCDIFISAASKQMDQLGSFKLKEDSENPNGISFVLEESRINLLENKVALVVPEGNPKGIDSFDTFVEKLKEGSIVASIGNADVPVGQYTKKILQFYSLSEEKLASDGCLTYGSNVKEVTTQVIEETVDCGIVYSTDAYSAGLEIVDTATDKMCGKVIYPAAVLNISKNQEAAADFLDYLKEQEAAKIFEKVGFIPIA